MADSHLLPDYYAVLQVHPDADQEVIEAAYRQLMKKHHPDLAGGDGRVASTLNQAYSVLKDVEQRRSYDMARIRFGTRPRPAQPASPTYGTSGRVAYTEAPKPPPVSTAPVDPQPRAPAAVAVVPSPPSGPFTWLAALYYMLPGPYEWEEGRASDLTATALLPVVGTIAYALLTGRLARVTGGSMTGSLVVVGFLLLLAIPLIKIAGPALLAVAPTLLVLSGIANPLLAQAHVPAWLAWGLAATISLLTGARLYVFGVLPMLALCWGVDRLIASH
jgi:hypothetical protein